MVSISYPPTQQSVIAQHQATLKTLLERRLAVAKARNDQALITILEQEQRQLNGEQSTQNLASTPLPPLRQAWNWLTRYISQTPQLSVEQIIDEGGHIWWRGFDTRTGKGIFADSEAEIVSWIEQNHLGY